MKKTIFLALVSVLYFAPVTTARAQSDDSTANGQNEKIMKSNESKQLIRDYFDAAFHDTEAAMDRYVADPELREHIIIFGRGLPDYRLEMEDILAEGDKVVVRARVIGTHEGPLFDVPASGKSVEFPIIIIYKLENGTIVDHWMQADTLSLMQQIGAVPMAETEQ